MGVDSAAWTIVDMKARVRRPAILLALLSAAYWLMVQELLAFRDGKSNGLSSAASGLGDLAVQWPAGDHLAR